VIVSSIPGRIRLRSDNFKNPDLPLDDLAGCPGVISWAMNTLTGSLLVEYDPAELNPLKAMQILNSLDPGALQQYAEYIEKTGMDPEQLFASRRPAPRTAPAGNGEVEIEGPDGSGRGAAPSQGELWNEVVGFGISLAALAVSGFLRVKKIHVFAGMFFLELAAKHAWRYRKRIKPPKGSKLGDFLLPASEEGGAKPSEAPVPEPEVAFLC
jgi:hypothetical protein